MTPFHPVQKPMKPAEFAETQLMESILNGTYGPGDALPGERDLALSLGVTRPTLRETLQRLSKEGWVTIAQGKPTRVNDYLGSGGLGVLNTLSQYTPHFSPDMVAHLLEVRTLILPGVAQKAVMAAPDAILDYLAHSPGVHTRAEAFALYDWGLQMLMVRLTANPVLRMVFNDFEPLYHRLGPVYFAHTRTRKISLAYYESLSQIIQAQIIRDQATQDQGIQDKTIHNKFGLVHDLVLKTMLQAQTLYQEIS